MKDLIGQRFGKLVVVSYSGKKTYGNTNKTIWLCKCDCGNEKIIVGGDLITHRIISCGCVRKKTVGDINRTHNMANKNKLYQVWKSMRKRCNNPNNKSYKNYGGRGISVCEEWQNDFKAFYDWAMANGYQEETLPNGKNRLTIDRINNNGNYEPANCRFVTNAENARNKKR